MAKRFTDTEIWKSQRWFRKLNPIHKLAFCYIKDNCSHAGIWKIDCSDLIEDLGIPSFDFNDFIEKVNTEYDKISGDLVSKIRLIKNNNSLIITGFIQFQYEGKDKKLNMSAPARTALSAMHGEGLLDTLINKGYVTLTEELHNSYIRDPQGFVKGLETPKDKDRVKDKDTLKQNTGKNGEFKPSGNFKAQAEELLAFRLGQDTSKT